MAAASRQQPLLPPARRAYGQSRAFKQAYRWHAGIEGRLHSLRRDYGLHQCDYHGEEGMHRWIGLGVLASNLRQIALAGAGSSSAISAKAQQRSSEKTSAKS